MRGTHEFHENWATTKFNDSTVCVDELLGIDNLKPPGQEQRDITSSTPFSLSNFDTDV